jgi:hypothetical protein
MHGILQGWKVAFFSQVADIEKSRYGELLNIIL